MKKYKISNDQEKERRLCKKKKKSAFQSTDPFLSTSKYNFLFKKKIFRDKQLKTSWTVVPLLFKADMRTGQLTRQF